MASKKTILIADPNKETLRGLKQALGEEYEVLLARDGSKALELAVLRYPDLIMFYRGCPLISASQFLRILRSNPRTEETPLIVLSDEPLTRESIAPSFLHGVLVKPLNGDEVAAHVAAVLRKVETARQVGGEVGAVSGSLEQFSMVDLLQVFTVNRRTGCLKLTRGTDERAEIFLHEGRIEEATVGVARGQKALFRLLAWDRGRFSFVPGARAPTASLNASTDSLLMEGMRQGDELARLLPELPGRSALLERLVPAEGLPEGLHRVTAEIFQLAGFYPQVGDLVDRAAATDMEVFVALKSLIDAKLLRVTEKRQALPGGALLTADELLALRSRLRRAGLPPVFLAAPKVAVLGADGDEIWQLGVAAARLPGFAPVDLERLHRLPIGTIGALKLDAGMTVTFFSLAAEDRLLPFGYGLSAGTIAGLVLGTGNLDDLAGPLGLLSRERRTPLLFVRRPGEPTLAGDEKRVVVEIEEISADWVRPVLATLLTQVAGTDLRGGNL